MANALMTRARSFPTYVRSWWKGGAPMIPTTEGMIPANYPWNYWQMNLPVGPNARNSTAEACIAAYSNVIAQLPAYHWRTLPDGSRQRVTTSAASRVLRRPNTYMTRVEAWGYCVRSMLAQGNGVAVAVRNDRYEIDSLHVIPPDDARPVVVPDALDPSQPAFFYALSVSENDMLPLAPDTDRGRWRYAVPAADVLHVKWATGRDPLQGESPIAAAATAVRINNALGNHQASFMGNMARPSGILQSDVQLTPKQMDDLRKAWTEQTTGPNAGGTPIVAWGFKWQAMSLSANDAQIIETMRWSSAEIARCFRVPAAVLGDATSDGLSRNNTEVVIAQWLASGLGYVLESIETGLENLFMLPANEYIEFDTDHLFRTDLAGLIETLSKAVQNGIMAPNEARRRLQLPPVRGGDVPRVQQQMIPVDTSPWPTTSNPAASTADTNNTGA